MSLDNNQKEALNRLYCHRQEIEHYLSEIEVLIQTYFPEEFPVANQHWLPQIKTGLKDHTKWLPRGQYSMDYTLNRLTDKLINDSNKGVNKYIQ